MDKIVRDILENQRLLTQDRIDEVTERVESYAQALRDWERALAKHKEALEAIERALAE